MTHKQAQTVAAFTSFAATLFAFIALLGTHWRDPESDSTCRYGLFQFCCGSTTTNCWDLDATGAWTTSLWLFAFATGITGLGASFSIYHAFKEETEGQDSIHTHWSLALRSISSVLSTGFFIATLVITGLSDATNTQDTDNGRLALSYWLALVATILSGLDTGAVMGAITMSCLRHSPYELVETSA